MKSMENSSPVVIINCVINVPLMLIAIIGNALVLASILRTPSLLSVPSTVFLCNLAITDLLVGLALQPVHISSELQQPVSTLLTNTRDGIAFSLCGVSLLTMTAISFDRHLILRYHMNYPQMMTTKLAIGVSASLWLISFLLSWLSIWKRSMSYLYIGVCMPICFVISSVSYIKVYLIVRHHQIQIQAQQQAVNSFNASLNTQGNRNLVASKKLAVNSFIYYFFIILCYLPFLLYLLLRGTAVIGFDRNWFLVVSTVVFFNSSINPFLYCWRNHEIRTSVGKVVRMMVCRQTEEATLAN